MIKIERIAVMNFENAIRGARNPMNSWSRMDSYFDENGSFIWPLIDGEKNIIDLGKLVEEEFGEKANPLYERLAKYFQILDSYGFITWNK